MASEIATAFVRVRPNMTGFAAETEEGVRSGFSHLGAIIAGAFAAEEVFHFGKEAVQGAASLQKSMEAINLEFGKAGESVTEFGDKAAEKLGISAQTADATSAKFGILFKNLGIGQKQAAGMTINLEKLAGSLSNIRGVDPSGALGNLTTAMLGNLRSLKQLGLAIDVHQIKQEAFKLGLTKTTKDAITPAIKAQAIYALATQHLGEFQRQAAAHSGDLANKERVLRAEWSNAVDALGTALLPAMTKLVGFLADTLPGGFHAAEVAVSGFVDQVKGVVSFIAPAFQPIFKLIGDVTNAFKSGGISGAIDKLKTDFEQMSPVAKIAALAIGAIAAALVASAVAAAPMTAITLAVIGLAEGFKYAYDHSAKFREIVGQVSDYLQANVIPALQNIAKTLTSVLGQAVDFVVAKWPQIQQVISEVVHVVMALWDRFGGTILAVINNSFHTAVEVVTQTMNAIKAAISLVLDLLTGKWGRAWGDMKTLVSSTLGAIGALIQGAVTNLGLEAAAIGRAILDGVVAGASALATKIGAVFHHLGQIISGWVGSAYAFAFNIGRAIVDGIISGLGDLFDRAKNAIVGAVKGALSFAHLHLGSTAEEHAGKEVGKPIAEGIIMGFLEGTADLPAKMSQKLRDSLEAARKVVEEEQTSFGNAFSNFANYAQLAFSQIQSNIKTPAEILLAKMQKQDTAKQLKDNLKSAQDALAQAVSESGLDKTLTDAVTQAQARLDEALARQQEQPTGKGKTKSLAQQIAEQLAVTNATDALQKAQTALGGEAGQISSLQAQVTAAQRAITEQNLQDQAAKERAHQDQINQIRQLQFNQQLTQLQTELGKQGAAHEAAQKKIIALLKKYGIDYRTSGQALGEALANGLRDSLPSVEAAAEAIAKTIADHLKVKSPTAKGPMSDLNTWWARLPDTLVSSLGPRSLSDALVSALSLSSGSVSPSGAHGPDALDRQILAELREQTKLAREGVSIHVGVAGGGDANKVAAAASR